ncbi:MAG: LD-carboxypeptidase [Bradymonadia bacterium]
MPAPLRPPPLPEHPVVRVVHPSGSIRPAHRPRLQAGVEALRAAGCEVRWASDRMFDVWRGYYAGSDEVRAQELISALSEPGVDIIWCARGGSGAARVTPEIINAARGLSPRILVGFSDVTALLSGLQRHLGWVTFHGPTVTLLGDDPSLAVRSLDALRRPRWSVTCPPGPGPELRGAILGGNLMVLASLAGTKLMPVDSGSIVLLEEVGESRYRIDRAFHQLLQTPWLQHAHGVWLGDLGLDAESTLQTEAMALDVSPLPLITGAPAGHRGPVQIVPLGWPGVLSPEQGIWRGDEG